MASHTQSQMSTSYQLPSDREEHKRLEEQSAALGELMHNNIFHAPIDNPAKIIDIGCGTGTVTLELARRYPNAHVYGVDISPIPRPENMPPNVHFVQGDIGSLVDSAQGPFVRGTFDYVFSRLLIMGVRDWQSWTELTSSLVSPNGWIEYHDLDLEFYERSESSTMVSKASDWDWIRALNNDCKNIPLDLHAGRHVRAHLAKTDSNSNVDFREYRWTLAPGPQEPHESRLAKYSDDYFEGFFQMVVNRVCGSQRSESDMEALKLNVSECKRNMEAGTYMPFVVTWANIARVQAPA